MVTMVWGVSGMSLGLTHPHVVWYFCLSIRNHKNTVKTVHISSRRKMVELDRPYIGTAEDDDVNNIVKKFNAEQRVLLAQ